MRAIYAFDVLIAGDALACLQAIRFLRWERVHLLAATLGIAVLGGCASTSQDGAFGDVTSIARQRVGKDLAWMRRLSDESGIKARIDPLLAKPLTVDDAVQVALLNNRGLQATYAELGISEAELVQAARLPNPGFEFARTRIGDETRVERTFSFALASLLTMPLRVAIEERRVERTKLLVANEVLRVAADTRKAYFNAVAAAETVRYMEQVRTAAEAGADLASRMAKAGNWSKLDQAREYLFYLDAATQLARARQVATSDRERLIRLLGLRAQDPEPILPERLPDLPATRVDPASLEQLALEQRLDIRAEKLETEALASSLGLTRATRFINVLEGGYRYNTQSGLPVEKGYQLSVEIPIFDWGDARVAKAESTYMQAVNRLAGNALTAQSEVRDAYQTYATAYDVARNYRDEVVPLRKNISEEVLLRYNAMLLSVFELLADAREQVASVNASIQALRDFWLAETELQRNVGGKLPPPTLAMQLESFVSTAATTPSAQATQRRPAHHRKGN